MPTFSRLDLNIDQGIAHITLNKPEEFNRLAAEFWSEFPAALNAIDKDASARVVVISAQGKHFCSGVDTDLFEMYTSDLEPGRHNAWRREHVLYLQSAFTALERVRIPVIAAIQGACIGAGVGLISACDMRYCSTDAFFSIEETNAGITCDIGSLQRLPQVMSETNLREWAYTGKRIDAERAKAWQLIGEVYDDPAALLHGVMDIAGEITQKSPLVLHGSKLSMNYNRNHSVEEGLEYIATFNAGIVQAEEVKYALEIRKKKSAAEFDDLAPRFETTLGV